MATPARIAASVPDNLCSASVVGGYVVPWKGCLVCRRSDGATSFRSPAEFCRHLRDYHCTKEGGSFVCRYGPNGVCPSLPVEGVSDQDYEDHVARDHVATESNSSSSTPASPSTLRFSCLQYIGHSGALKGRRLQIKIKILHFCDTRNAGQKVHIHFCMPCIFHCFCYLFLNFVCQSFDFLC